MLDIISRPESQPWIALLVGVILMAAVSSWYRNDFNVARYQERFIRRREKAGLIFRKFFEDFVNVIRRTWLLAFGIVAIVTIVLFNVYASLPGNAVAAPQSSTRVQDTIVTHRTPTRTVIDTSKPWVYDFSKLPNGAIDTKIFNIENGPETANYNNELETYTTSTDNVRIQNGTLIIEAKPQDKDGKAYTSARINTDKSFSFTYGSLEVKAKLPRGVGTWPAAWLMPADPLYKAADYPSAKDQTRIYTLNGELDFLESVGYIPGLNFPAAHSYDSLGQALQYTPAYTDNPYDEYHTYGIVKTPTLIEFTLDGNVYAKRTKTGDNALSWPFNQPYYLILNLSLGGTWAGKDGVDDSLAPWDYTIKSITYTPLAVQ